MVTTTTALLVLILSATLANRNDEEGQTVTHHKTLQGKAEICLQGHDYDEREEAEDVDQAATQAGDVGLVEEGADQVAEGNDAQAVVTEIQEQEEAVAVGQDFAVCHHQGEDDDGQHQVCSTLYEPGKEVADGVDSHHLHVLWDKKGNKVGWTQVLHPNTCTISHTA